MVKEVRPQFEITLKSPSTDSRVLVDGRDVSKAIRSVSASLTAGDHLVVTLTLVPQCAQVLVSGDIEYLKALMPVSGISVQSGEGK